MLPDTPKLMLKVSESGRLIYMRLLLVVVFFFSSLVGFFMGEWKRLSLIYWQKEKVILFFFFLPFLDHAKFDYTILEKLL